MSYSDIVKGSKVVLNSSEFLEYLEDNVIDIDNMGLEIRCYKFDKFIDSECIVKKKKTIADVRTVQEAIKCHKSSKTHKLFIKSNDKQDRTRSKESRKRSKIIMARV